MPWLLVLSNSSDVGWAAPFLSGMAFRILVAATTALAQSSYSARECTSRQRAIWLMVWMLLSATPFWRASYTPDKDDAIPTLLAHSWSLENSEP